MQPAMRCCFGRAHADAHLARPQRVDGQLVKTRPLPERLEDEPTRLDDATHSGQLVTEMSHLQCQALARENLTQNRHTSGARH